MASEFSVTEGTPPGGLPYFRFGTGPRLIVLRGFTTTHDNPKGMQRRFEIGMLAPLARRFDVYAVNRAPDSHPARRWPTSRRSTPPRSARHSASPSTCSACRRVARSRSRWQLTIPTSCAGSSSSAPQAASARTPPKRMRYIDAVAEGKRGAQHLASMKVSSKIGARILAPVMWLLDPLADPRDPSDMVAFARAEDAFDVTSRLDDITAPTLVIAGSKDNVASSISCAGRPTVSATDASSSTTARATPPR